MKVLNKRDHPPSNWGLYIDGELVETIIGLQNERNEPAIYSEFRYSKKHKFDCDRVDIKEIIVEEKYK